ncbi:hypothetical protein EDB85DRAFT_1897934 [Lactarius pseudohatsudake]|nr:hypothetical protein EDB85DRAFT_1897934 [Lactarius pseudohatsudake]
MLARWVKSGAATAPPPKTRSCWSTTFTVDTEFSFSLTNHAEVTFRLSSTASLCKNDSFTSRTSRTSRPTSPSAINPQELLQNVFGPQLGNDHGSGVQHHRDTGQRYELEGVLAPGGRRSPRRTECPRSEPIESCQNDGGGGGEEVLAQKWYERGDGLSASATSLVPALLIPDGNKKSAELLVPAARARVRGLRGAEEHHARRSESRRKGSLGEGVYTSIKYLNNGLRERTRRAERTSFPQDAPCIAAPTPESGFVLKKNVLKPDGIAPSALFLSLLYADSLQRFLLWSHASVFSGGPHVGDDADRQHGTVRIRSENVEVPCRSGLRA